MPTENRFTGHKEDGTGLIYMNARYYDPALGQFISPDTIVPDAANLFDYNRYMYVRGNPLKFTDPSGHQTCAAGDAACWQGRWQSMNRWYEAHGYLWSAGTNHWSSVAAPRFADESILDDTVGEGGIQWSSLPDGVSWTFDRKVKIATGIVQFGQRLSGGLQRIAVLVGGHGTMAIGSGGNLICRGGVVPCTLPTWGNSVMWPVDYIDANRTEFIATQAVHELAHVIDWQSGFRFSAAWEARALPALTNYGGCQGDCIQPWEFWAEAVATFVYGASYVNRWSPLGPTIPLPTGPQINLQVNEVQALLEGWVRP